MTLFREPLVDLLASLQLVLDFELALGFELVVRCEIELAQVVYLFATTSKYLLDWRLTYAVIWNELIANQFDESGK